MEQPITCPPPREEKYLGAEISMALMEIDELLASILKEYGLLIRNFNPMINLERLCDPATLSRKSLSDVRFALDKYLPDRKMIDSSMKNIFVEAIGAFYVYEKFFFIYKDCFKYGFQSLLDRAEGFRKQEAEGKSTPRKVLRIENFKKILAIAEENKEKHPKLLKLKGVVTYHNFIMKKIIFANNNTAPYLKEIMGKWGLKSEIVKSSKGIKNLKKLKSGQIDCLIYTSVPKIKLEIDRLVITHYLMPKNKKDKILKNECNGSIAPEIVYYIFMEHFMDKRVKRVIENRPKSPKKKKGQGTLDLWG